MSRRDNDKAAFGIMNWFLLQGINDESIQDGMKSMFLEDFGFCDSNIRDCRLGNASNAFIQKNFYQFKLYVKHNLDLYIELISNKPLNNKG